ncbi:Kinase-like protein [Mycena chlorophos]|uniref:non-specific serine/threonine protein kinase n=1 Tax=Mycena chlorophos TaxID=658473 RepID=A0A8H6TLD3_MYCCL|nr:Kinase-like protein [Mycena chlorophos]
MDPKRIVLSEYLGEGSYSTIFRGTVSSSRAIVAVKKSRVSLWVKRPGLQHEARILHILQGHRAIPRLIGYYRGLHFEYIAMELLGDTIKNQVREDRGLPNMTVVRVGLQLLSALAFLLDIGVVHRDIKPANILLCPGDRSKICLIDFGLSSLLGLEVPGVRTQRTRKSPIVGTLDWCSINVHAGRYPLGPSDDFESVVYVLLFLLGGSLPWRIRARNSRPEPEYLALSRTYESKKAFDTTDVDSTVGELLGNILTCARALDPADRPKYSETALRLEAAVGTAIQTSDPLDWTPCEVPPILKRRLEAAPPSRLPDASCTTPGADTGSDDSDGSSIYSDSNSGLNEQAWSPNYDRDASLTFPEAQAKLCDGEVTLLC